MNNFVSIIIPTFNNFTTIRRCLDSVLNQTYSLYEIILINDGSTDGTEKICEEYSILNNKIRYYSQNNQGVSSARNNGIKNSIGEWITFVDADDFVSKDFIEALISRVNETNSDFCLSQMFRYNNESQYIDEVLIKGDDYVRLFNNYNFFAPGGKLYRKKIIEDNNIEFDKNLIQGEDRQFNKEYFFYCNSISITANVVYFYPQSSTCLRLLPIENQLYRIKRAKFLLEMYKTCFNKNVIDCLNQEMVYMIELGIKSCLYISNKSSFYNDMLKLDIDFYIKHIETNSIKHKFIVYLLKKRMFRLYRFLVKK